EDELLSASRADEATACRIARPVDLSWPAQFSCSHRISAQNPASRRHLAESISLGDTCQRLRLENPHLRLNCQLWEAATLIWQLRASRVPWPWHSLKSRARSARWHSPFMSAFTRPTAEKMCR